MLKPVVTSNFLEGFLMVHQSFTAWVNNPTRPSIWARNGSGDVVGMSPHFRKIARPIMFKAYHCIRLDGNTYCYPNILNSVEIQNGSVVTPDPPDNRITTCLQVKDIIRSLKSMVNMMVAREPVQPLPRVVGKFFTLCNRALGCPDLSTLREYAYWITLNPLIYNMDESFRFVHKVWYIWNNDRRTFEGAIDLADLIEFPAVARGASPSSPFYRVYTDIERQTNPNQIPNFGISSYIYPRKAAIKYVGDLLRHFGSNKSQLETFGEIQEALPGFVPVVFECMVRYCISRRNNPVHLFAGPRSLIQRFQQWPLVISLSDRELVDRSINGDTPLTFIPE